MLRFVFVSKQVARGKSRTLPVPLAGTSQAKRTIYVCAKYNAIHWLARVRQHLRSGWVIGFQLQLLLPRKRH